MTRTPLLVPNHKGCSSLLQDLDARSYNDQSGSTWSQLH